MKEFPAFEDFVTDEYSLFLPSLTFSDDSIEKSLPVGGLCRDVLRIDVGEGGPVEVYLERTGLFIELEEGWYKGNRIEIPYQLKAEDLGEACLHGQIICTYFGGERVVPVSVDIAEPVDQVPKEAAVGEAAANNELVIRHKPTDPYLVQPIKRAFAAGEKGVVRIVNNQGYPITVKVLTLDKELTVDHRHLTVEDVAYLKVTYKRRPLLNFIRRQNENPFVQSTMTLAVRHDQGEDHRRLNLVFTQLKNRMPSDIDNDRAYRRAVVLSRQAYNRYLLRQDKSALAQAVKTVERAMGYHLTDLPLRLYYILLLIEKNEFAKVKEQVGGILAYSRHFPEGDYEECLEILNTLSVWLSSNAVSGQVMNWPMTGLRQLYRIRVYGRKRVTFDDLEAVYDQGVGSAHLLAQAASLMNEKPIVPGRPSVFYRHLLIWAVNHNAIEPLWLGRLETSSGLLLKHNLINSNGTMQIHAVYPQQGVLKLLLSLLIKEDRVGVYGQAVSLEGLKQAVYLPDLEVFYCRCVCASRGQIWWDYIHLLSVINRLTYEERAYLLRLYLDDPMTEKSKHAIAIRQSRSLLMEGDGVLNSDDVLAVAAWWTRDRMVHHDWKEIRLLLERVSLPALWQQDEGLTLELIRSGNKGIGYPWLHKKLPVELWLQALDEDALRSLAHWFVTEGLTDELWQAALVLGKSGYDLEEWLHWVNTIAGVNRDRARYLMKSRYDRKGEGALVVPMMADFSGSISDMIRLLDKMPEHKTCPEAFVKGLLFKGFITRQQPAEMARIYSEHYSDLTGRHFSQVMLNYFVGQLLIEERYGLQCLVPVFEDEVIRKPGEAPVALILGLLKLYQLYGSTEPEIVVNLLKKVIKNGIIFPWFKDLSLIDLSDTGERLFKKALFFTYHSRPDRQVTLYYRAQDQERFRSVKMKHTVMGFYTAYVLSFFGDEIEYYTTESGGTDDMQVTGSGIRNNRQAVQAADVLNDFDVVNTIEMSRLVDDTDSVRDVVGDFARQRHLLEATAELM